MRSVRLLNPLKIDIDAILCYVCNTLNVSTFFRTAHAIFEKEFFRKSTVFRPVDGCKCMKRKLLVCPNMVVGQPGTWDKNFSGSWLNKMEGNDVINVVPVKRTS